MENRHACSLPSGRSRIAASRPQARPHDRQSSDAAGRSTDATMASVPTGIADLDARLEGGLPRGHLSEVIGPAIVGTSCHSRVGAGRRDRARGSGGAHRSARHVRSGIGVSQRHRFHSGCCGCAARRPVRRASACRANTARCRRALDRAVKALNHRAAGRRVWIGGPRSWRGRAADHQAAAVYDLAAPASSHRRQRNRVRVDWQRSRLRAAPAG